MLYRFEFGSGVPPLDEIIPYIAGLPKPRAVDVLRSARSSARVLVQPRCGVAGQTEMIELLGQLDDRGHADMLTLTIDSHTRLGRFGKAERLLREARDQLNGYPLVAHGWQAGRQLNERFSKPIQIRHGSPDARQLFATSLASGFTSFEGGGISYNLPYAKSFPLAASLNAWREIDATCAWMETAGIAIDREFFGSLSGVINPPSISLAVVFLEAILAAREGCTCLSLAIPQNGSILQDVAALKAIPKLARLYLPDEADVFPVLHQFMGVFPKEAEASAQLIFLGGLTARIGGATKTITKTVQEALGLPDGPTNAAGLRTTLNAFAPQFLSLGLSDEAVAEELYWIERETRQLLDPIIEQPDLIKAIVQAFHDGRLDIPFPANSEARGAIMPVRDASIAVRYGAFGNLPFSADIKARNDRRLSARTSDRLSYEDIIDGIFFFAKQQAGTVSGAGPRKETECTTPI